MRGNLNFVGEAIAFVSKNPGVTARIALPPVLCSLLSAWLVSLPFEVPFVWWHILFTAFFFANMGLVWHRWQLLGEPPTWPKRAGAATRKPWRMYRMLAGKISLAAAIGCVLVLAVFAGLIDALLGAVGAPEALVFAAFFNPAAADSGLALVIFSDWLPRALIAIGFAALLLGLGAAAPALAIGLPREITSPLPIARILIGAISFGTLWLTWFVILHLLELVFGPLPDLLKGAILQLVNAPIVLAMAAYLVVADPETWAQDTAENRQRLQERMKAGLDLADLSTSLPMLVSAIRRQINKSAR